MAVFKSGSVAVTSEVVQVTPSLARDYLSRAARNRPVSDDRVGLYATDMAEGNWEVTNQGIGFSADGELLDGRHRLMAVIMADVPVRMLVTNGLELSAQDHVDVGRPRSIADQLHINHGLAYARKVVAVMRMIMTIRGGGSGLSVRSPISLNTASRMIEDWREHLDWLETDIGFSFPAPVTAAWLYTHRATRKVELWSAEYVTGANLNFGDPLLALRETTKKSKPHNSTDRAALALKALNALWAKINGLPVQKLYGSSLGLVGIAKMMGDTEAVNAWSKYSSKASQRSPR